MSIISVDIPIWASAATMLFDMRAKYFVLATNAQ